MNNYYKSMIMLICITFIIILYIYLNISYKNIYSNKYFIYIQKQNQQNNIKNKYYLRNINNKIINTYNNKIIILNAYINIEDFYDELKNKLWVHPQNIQENNKCWNNNNILSIKNILTEQCGLLKILINKCINIEIIIIDADVLLPNIHYILKNMIKTYRHNKQLYTLKKNKKINKNFNCKLKNIQLKIIYKYKYMSSKIL